MAKSTARSSAPKKATKKGVGKSAPAKATTEVKLLAGGNPQIAKGYGDAPVQAYLQAIPDWKRAVAMRLDELITHAYPKVQKAVKWNTPMYGTDEKTFFMGFHMITKYVKVAFFQGAQLEPIPPDAQDCRHESSPSTGRKASIFFCPTSDVSDPPERQRRRVRVDAVVRLFIQSKYHAMKPV